MPDPCENLVSTPCPKRITLESSDKINNQSCILCIVSVGRPKFALSKLLVSDVFYWLYRFSLLHTIKEDLIFGLVRMYVTHYRFSWTIIYIRFGTKLYRQIVGIPMGTNSAPLIADLFLFCYERYFMKDLSNDNQTEIIKAFNPTSRYLDDLLNIDNPNF